MSNSLIDFATRAVERLAKPYAEMGKIDEYSARQQLFTAVFGVATVFGAEDHISDEEARVLHRLQCLATGSDYKDFPAPVLTEMYRQHFRSQAAVYKKGFTSLPSFVEVF